MTRDSVVAITASMIGTLMELAVMNVPPAFEA